MPVGKFKLLLPVTKSPGGPGTAFHHPSHGIAESHRAAAAAIPAQAFKFHRPTVEPRRHWHRRRLGQAALAVRKSLL